MFMNSAIRQKIQEFYCCKFSHISHSQSCLESYTYELPIKEEKIKMYRNQNQTQCKQLRQYGFMKKFSVICQFIPYVCSWRPTKLEVGILKQIIKQVYDSYELYIRWGWWKQEDHQTHLQQFVLMILDYKYNTLSGDKRKIINSFDKFLLSFFFTMNLYKSSSNFLKNFNSFLNETYPPSYFFLFLCLRAKAQILPETTIISSSIFTKIIKILQSDSNNLNSLSGSPLLSNFNSLATHQKSMETEKVQEKSFEVDLQVFFSTPISESFVIPKVQMFRILSVCGFIEHKEDDTELRWEQFLKMYFCEGDDINCEGTSFEHFVSMGLAKATFQLGEKLINDQNKRRQFLEKAFTYVFEILQLIFQTKQPEIQNNSTKHNILSLKRTFNSMKSLNDYGITVLNKFTKRILKNGYILSLYQEYA